MEHTMNKNRHSVQRVALHTFSVLDNRGPLQNLYTIVLHTHLGRHLHV